jgi:hypothetical protein
LLGLSLVLWVNAVWWIILVVFVAIRVGLTAAYRWHLRHR